MSINEVVSDEKVKARVNEWRTRPGADKFFVQLPDRESLTTIADASPSMTIAEVVNLYKQKTRKPVEGLLLKRRQLNPAKRISDYQSRPSRIRNHAMVTAHPSLIG
jgi:hypothetical protein